MTKPYHIKIGLTDNDVLEMYRYMVLARKLEERMLLLIRDGKAPFVDAGQVQLEIVLTDNDVLAMYRYMVLARKLDERMLLLNRAGKAPFVVSGQGQEATQIGAGFALDLTKDYIAPYYRDLGLVLVAGMTSQEAMLHL